MFALSMQVRVKPGMMEETWKSWDRNILHSKNHLPGFNGAVILVGRDNGTIKEITLWESEAHATAVFESDWAQHQFYTFGHLLVGPPVFEVFDAVTVSPRMELFAGVM